MGFFTFPEFSSSLTIEYIIKITLFGALSLQALLVLFFTLKVYKVRRINIFKKKNHPRRMPQSEVILCLRGIDFSLEKMLGRLAVQDYPGPWILQVIIDSKSENLQEFVENLILQLSERKENLPTWKKVNISLLENYPPTGSLKCSAIRQACENLNSKSDIVALIDADAFVSKNWLKCLAEGLTHENIGAVSGNRWYAPKNNSILGWSRAVWNAGALVMMTLLEIPWGGSLAVRKEVIKDGEWIRTLKHSLCEDTSLIRPLEKLNLKYKFLPDLIIIDRSDDLNFSVLLDWLTRQLLTVRLHHHAWSLISFHGISTTFLLAVIIIRGDLAAFIIYELGCILLLVWIKRVALKESCNSLPSFTKGLFLGQLITGLSTMKAMFTRHVEWSGINYEITSSPKGVKNLDYPTLNREVSS